MSAVTTLAVPDEPEFRPVRRTGTGLVDLSDPLVDQFHNAIEAIGSDPAIADRAALMRLAIDCKYWELTNALLAPGYASVDYAAHHRTAWNWLHSIDQTRPRPMVMCLNRGGAKTTTLQLMLAQVAMMRLRPYCLYVQSTQTAAEGKVSDVGELLASPIMTAAYPDVASTYVTAKGTARDWRRARIRTRSGLTIDALGMDQAIRGAKVEDDRPGMIILDDLEEKHDTPYMTRKKIEIVTNAIIPAGAENVIIVYIQNMIHGDSMMAQLLDKRADFLSDRITVGPVPQVWDLEYEEQIPSDEDPRRYVVLSGQPSWAGLDLETTEKEMNDMGLAAFMSEKQHKEHVVEGDTFPSENWERVSFEAAWGTDYIWLARGWDLAATEKETSDFTVGCLIGIDQEYRATILHVARFRAHGTSVDDNIARVAAYDAQFFGSNQAVSIVIEKQPGAAGVTWEEDQAKLLAKYPVHHVPATGSKLVRAQSLSAEQQRGWVKLSGDMPGEGAGRQWTGPFVRELAAFPTGRHDDQVDAAATAYNWLRKKVRIQRRGRMGRGTQSGTTSDDW